MGKKAPDFSEIKKENDSLKRQITRLRKHLEQKGEVPEFLELAEKKPKNLKKEKSNKKSCTQCNSTELLSLVIPGKTTIIFSCKQCKNQWKE